MARKAGKLFLFYWLPINFVPRRVKVFIIIHLFYPGLNCHSENTPNIYNFEDEIFLSDKYDWTAREVNSNWTERYKQNVLLPFAKALLCFAFMYFTSFLFSAVCYDCSLPRETKKTQREERKNVLRVCGAVSVCGVCCWNSWHCNQLENLFGKVHEKIGGKIVKVYVLLKFWAAGVSYQTKPEEKNISCEFSKCDTICFFFHLFRHLFCLLALKLFGNVSSRWMVENDNVDNDFGAQHVNMFQVQRCLGNCGELWS